MTYDTTGGYPDLVDIRAWVLVPATVIDDAALTRVAGAEQSAQLALCPAPDPGVDPPLDLADDLYQALLRRIARHLAAKSVPLGLLGVDSEFGTARLSKWDSEVERLEGPHRAMVLG